MLNERPPGAKKYETTSATHEPAKLSAANGHTSILSSWPRAVNASKSKLRGYPCLAGARGYVARLSRGRMLIMA